MSITESTIAVILLEKRGVGEDTSEERSVSEKLSFLAAPGKGQRPQTDAFRRQLHSPPKVSTLSRNWGGESKSECVVPSPLGGHKSHCVGISVGPQEEEPVLNEGGACIP